MKNSLWKLTALAGVVGIVLLAFLQAQKGINSADNGEFVPADLDEFANEEPDLGEPGDEDAPPFDAVDGSYAAVGDPIDGDSFDAGDFDSGAFDENGFDAVDPGDFASDSPRPAAAERAGFAADEWDTDTRSGDTELKPIRRRRDDSVRTADGREPAGGEAPGILRVGDERLQPVPSRGERPQDRSGAPAFDEEFPKAEFGGKDDFAGDDDFGPDLFSQDPPGTADSPSRATPEEDVRSRPRLPLPERFDGELKPVPSGASLDAADEFPAADFAEGEFSEGKTEFGDPGDFDAAPAEKKTAAAPERRDAFDDDFPSFEDDAPRRTGPLPTPDDRTPTLSPFPPLGDEPVDEDEPADRIRTIDADSDPRDAGPDFAADPVPFDDEKPPFGDEPMLEDPDLGNPRALELGAPAPLEAFPTDDEPAADPAPETITDDAPPAEPNRVTPPRDAERLERADLLGNATIDESMQIAPQKPRLTIEKIAPEHALLGQPMVYTIIVKNVGETPARQVVVHDRIPKGTELTGTIPRAELVERSADADESNVEKVLRWKLGTVEAGAMKKIAVRVTPISEGQVGSVATVNFVAEVAARTKVSSPSLEFSLTGPAKARLGKPAVFQFDVRNSGSDIARSVVIRDLVPAGLKHPGGDDLEYVVGDLEPGDSKSIRLSLTAVQEGEVVNRAVATADGGVKVESTARLQVVGTDLAVSRTGPGKRYVGRAALFTNVVANNGDVPLENVTVVETLPKGITFVEAAGGGQYNATRHEIAWRLDRLGPKESRVLKVKLLPKAPGKFTCTVTAKSDTGQEASTSAMTQAIGYTSLGLDVEGGGPPIFVGDTVTFTITPVNRGTTNAANVAVEIEISPELEVASVNAPTKHSQSGNKVRFSAMPTLGGGAKAGYEVTLRAVKPGEGRVRTSVVADDLTRPLQQDAAVRVVSENP